MPNIVSIAIVKTWETCERTRYYVELTTDEGFSTTPCCHSTGSVHKTLDGQTKAIPGLSIEEARSRALYDADDWSDLLGIPVDPFEDDGVIHTPKNPMRRFTTRRVLDERRRIKDAANSGD